MRRQLDVRTETGAKGPLAQSTSRRSFLRLLGTTVAAGIGLALLPLQAAAAPCSTCCKDSSCQFCSGTPVRYRCQPGNCCICHADVGTCFSTQQCQCP